MSTIDSAGKARGAFPNRNSNSISGKNPALDFASSAKRAASDTPGKPVPGVAVAKAIAETGRDLDSSNKLKKFLSNPANRQSVQRQLSQLSTEIKRDMTLDSIAQLPARDLAIIRGFYSIMSVENLSRLELIR